MTIFTRLINWWRSLFVRHDFKRIHCVSSINQIPDVLDREAYIVKRGGRQLWLVFDCPCDKKHRLNINLSKNRSPFWQVQIQKNLFSVYPSVWIGDECHSHFWIKNSDIIVVNDNF